MRLLCGMETRVDVGTAVNYKQSLPNNHLSRGPAQTHMKLFITIFQENQSNLFIGISISVLLKSPTCEICGSFNSFHSIYNCLDDELYDFADAIPCPLNTFKSDPVSLYNGYTDM